MTNDLGDLICDFVGGSFGYRLKYGGGRSQALAKAIGLKGGKNLHIIDATAGLGRDAFLLASLGAHVTLIERNRQMHKLLEEGILRAQGENDNYAEIVARMTLVYGDAKELLPRLKPDTVLIDPMHPPRRKTALVKKELRIIRDIFGTDPDSKDLMDIALANANSRVVLKWPMKAEPMLGLPTPSHQIVGKTTRYDVFIQT